MNSARSEDQLHSCTAILSRHEGLITPSWFLDPRPSVYFHIILSSCSLSHLFRSWIYSFWLSLYLSPMMSLLHFPFSPAHRCALIYHPPTPLPPLLRWKGVLCHIVSSCISLLTSVAPWYVLQVVLGSRINPHSMWPGHMTTWSDMENLQQCFVD